MKNVASASASLKLDSSRLLEVCQLMAERIRQGLAAEGRELAAIPTYLPPPCPEKMRGEALVVDIGGSNVRAARVALKGPGKVAFPAGCFSALLPSAWDSAEDFFLFQAELAGQLGDNKKVSLGYCFSYPARPHPGRDATLLKWTKGLNVPGVVGRRVGDMLGRALSARNIEVGPATVLNDAVAALMAGYWLHSPEEPFGDFIGLIVGTGNNMAATFPRELMEAKLEISSYPAGRMAVNLESGNFHPPCLTRFDEELDLTREDAGVQRLEKAVSGKFLPELYNFIFPADPVEGAREMFVRARTAPSSPGGELALALINRSADLVAATLAGTIVAMRPRGRVGILAEGSMIASNRAYQERILSGLSGLLDALGLAGSSPRIFFLPSATLIGSALAAVTAAE